MITKTQAYQVGDKTFASLEEAQTHELSTSIEAGTENVSTDQCKAVALHLVANKEKIIDILTTGPRSKPKARKINGAKRNKALKEVAA